MKTRIGAIQEPMLKLNPPLLVNRNVNDLSDPTVQANPPVQQLPPAPTQSTPGSLQPAQATPASLQPAQSDPAAAQTTMPATQQTPAPTQSTPGSLQPAQATPASLQPAQSDPAAAQTTMPATQQTPAPTTDTTTTPAATSWFSQPSFGGFTNGEVAIVGGALGLILIGTAIAVSK